MSKYFDLKDRIYEDTARSSHITIGEVLIWLDEHPNQAPGRTITRTEYRDTLDQAVKVSGHGDDWERGFCTGLTVGGTKVVPDPEPTNAELIERKLRELREDPGEWMTYATDSDISGFARVLDAKGVRVVTESE